MTPDDPEGTGFSAELNIVQAALQSLFNAVWAEHSNRPPAPYRWDWPRLRAAIERGAFQFAEDRYTRWCEDRGILLDPSYLPPAHGNDSDGSSDSHRYHDASHDSSDLPPYGNP